MAASTNCGGEYSLCGCCNQKRGWWTLCAGELFLRFRTSISDGLSEVAVERLRRTCGRNVSPVNLSDSKELQHSILALLNHDCDNSPIAWFGYSLSVAAAVAASMNRIGFWKESSGTLILRTKEVLSILLPLIASAVSFYWFQRLHVEVLSIQLEHHAQQSKGGDEDIAKADLEHRDMSKTRIPKERKVDACVFREGRKMTISWEDLVPGDVVQVQVTFPFPLLPSPRCTTPTLSPSSCS
jgi:hypothetical protein